jgi:hypothetical protein
LSDAARAFDGDLGRWLTVDVPRAIVDGGPVPERPQRAKRKRALFRR